MHGEGDRAVRLTASDMRRLIAEMLDCRMRPDYDRFSTYIDPGIVVYCNAWREGIVGPDVWAGAASLRELFRRTDENYFPLEHEILDMLVDGESAVVRWRGDWRRHCNAKVYPIDAAHFLRWKNGLVVEMHEFFDAHCAASPDGASRLAYEKLLEPPRPGLGRDEMERRARRLVSFQEAPDPDVIRRLCSPDIVCEFVGDRSRVPYAGRHTGVETLIDIVRAIRVDFEQQLFTIAEVLVEDARVAGRRQIKWRHRGTGRSGISELADFVRFEDGLIVELIEFRDSVTLLQMQD